MIQRMNAFTMGEAITEHTIQASESISTSTMVIVRQ